MNGPPVVDTDRRATRNPEWNVISVVSAVWRFLSPLQSRGCQTARRPAKSASTWPIVVCAAYSGGAIGLPCAPPSSHRQTSAGPMAKRPPPEYGGLKGQPVLCDVIAQKESPPLIAHRRAFPFTPGFHRTRRLSITSSRTRLGLGSAHQGLARFISTSPSQSEQTLIDQGSKNLNIITQSPVGCVGAYSDEKARKPQGPLKPPSKHLGYSAVPVWPAGHILSGSSGHFRGFLEPGLRSCCWIQVRRGSGKTRPGSCRDGSHPCRR